MAEEPNGGARRESLRSVVKMMDRFKDIASANTCFGTPIQVGDQTIIPAAEVMAGFGAGGGSGEGPALDDDEGTGNGEGAGGGGFSRARPVAVVVVAPEGVTVEPVLDVTQIAMAGLAAGAFLGFWLVRMLAITEAPAGRDKPPSLKAVVKALKSS
jgi:uncharacterized spore protein YtfJ